MSNIIEKYSRALKMYRDDGISVPVLPSEMRTLIADFLDLQRQNQHLLTVTKQQGRRIESMEALLDSGCTAHEEKRLGKWMQDVAVFLGNRAAHIAPHRENERD